MTKATSHHITWHIHVPSVQASFCSISATSCSRNANHSQWPKNLPFHMRDAVKIQIIIPEIKPRWGRRHTKSKDLCPSKAESSSFCPSLNLLKPCSPAVTAADAFPAIQGVHTQTCSGKRTFQSSAESKLLLCFFWRKGELKISLKISCTSPALCPRWRELKCTAHLPHLPEWTWSQSHISKIRHPMWWHL